MIDCVTVELYYTRPIPKQTFYGQHHGFMSLSVEAPVIQKREKHNNNNNNNNNFIHESFAGADEEPDL